VEIDILELVKMLAPMILKRTATRLKDAALGEFIRTMDPPQKSTYEFDDGTQEIEWTHLVLGDETVIGIGKRGERVRQAKRTK
jgi:hypothetical protein